MPGIEDKKGKMMREYWKVILSLAVIIGFVGGLVNASFEIYYFIESKYFAFFIALLTNHINAWLLYISPIYIIISILIFIFNRVIQKKFPDKKTGILEVSLITVTIFIIAYIPIANTRLVDLDNKVYGTLFFIALPFLTFLYTFLNLELFRNKISLKKICLRTMTFVIVLTVLINLVRFTFFNLSVSRKTPNVVVFIIDCLRTDHVGVYGYSRKTTPNIDALSKEGMILTDFYTNAPWTKPSMVSLFTSLIPLKHGVVSATNILFSPSLTLGRIAKEIGYKTYLFNGGNVFLQHKFGLTQGFDFYIQPEELTTMSVGGNAQKLIQQVIDVLKEEKKAPFFSYIHFMDAHLPYNDNKFNELFTKRKYLKPGIGPQEITAQLVREMTEEGKISLAQKEYIEDIYDAQIRDIDDSIGKLIKKLKDWNIFNNTIIIVTSDHGEEFWDHNNFEHGHTLYNELMSIPFIITGPNIEPGVVSERLRIIDVAPTLLDFIGRNKFESMQGKSFYPLLNTSIREAKGDMPVVMSGTFFGDEKYGIMEGEYSFIYNSSSTERKRPLLGYHNKNKFELYNIISDPDEKSNLSQVKNIAPYKKKLYEYINMYSNVKAETTRLTEEQKEKMKALGYIQ